MKQVKMSSTRRTLGFNPILLSIGLLIAICYLAHQCEIVSTLLIAPPQPSSLAAIQDAGPSSLQTTPGETNQPQPGSGGQSMQQQQQQQPTKLPKINIFISRNEIKKLLGIDAKIEYVKEGTVNLYPLGFTIPLGYNQSDIIFSWQNLGPTPVNYSISLVIGNIEAVSAPLINITRSGLIPSHEQVFKITLPCSGKVTDEVDVQVLINIVGQVQLDQDSGDLLDTMDSAAASAPPQVDLASSIAYRQQQLASASASASAASSTSSSAFPGSGASTGLQAANGSLAAAAAAGPEQAAQMQADEPPVQRTMRPVSYTLHIKRKKICTMHPVPVPKIRPPTQPVSKGTPAPLMPPATASNIVASTTSTAAPTGSSSAGQSEQQVLTSQSPTRWQTSNAPDGQKHSQPRLQEQASSARFQPPSQNELPAHHPALNGVHHTGQLVNGAQLGPASLDSRAGWPQSQATPTHPQKPAGFVYPNWPHSRISSVAPAPIAADNPLNEILKLGPTAATATATATSATMTTTSNSNSQTSANLNNGANININSSSSSSSQTTTNPLMITLILVSMVISIALIVLLLLGSSGQATSKRPFDKLNALTSCLMRRGSRVARGGGGPVGANQRLSAHLGHHHHHHHSKVATGGGGGIIGALRVPGHKASPSSASSVHSGLSAISGHSTTKPAFCLGQTTMSASNKSSQQHYTLGYYTITQPNGLHHHHHHHQQQQQQHYHYQHPPTADLLGTGYHPTPPTTNNNNSSSNNNNNNQPPIYHIATGNNNQTTRLTWNQGNGIGPDGFTIDGGSYVPLSNGEPRSESGSVYQTIY